MLHTVYIFKIYIVLAGDMVAGGSVYNVVDGSIPTKNFISCLVECMNSYNIRSHTFYEFNGLNI
jgi:hypothetical protein